MAKEKSAPEFGQSPYSALSDLAGDVEFAVISWTNNVQQHNPTDAEEAFEAWDEAVAEAHRVVDAAEALLLAAKDGRRAADLLLPDDENEG